MRFAKIHIDKDDQKKAEKAIEEIGLFGPFDSKTTMIRAPHTIMKVALALVEANIYHQVECECGNEMNLFFDPIDEKGYYVCPKCYGIIAEPLA